MLEHKDKCHLLTITFENSLKYTRFSTNSVNGIENMVLGLFYDALSAAVFM
jgi:hypothetical protein